MELSVKTVPEPVAEFFLAEEGKKKREAKIEKTRFPVPGLWVRA